MKKVKVAIVGAGYAAWLHLKAYQKVYGIDAQVKIIVDPDQERAFKLAEEFGVLETATSFDEVIHREDIDVIDIVTPPSLHLEQAIQAVEAGKHVICEKPLSGYFGQKGDPEPIGKHVPKRMMLEELLQQLNIAQQRIEKSGMKFMYAENYVYCPSVQESAKLARLKNARFLFLKGEESLRGSSSALSGQWNKVGGGSLMRTGSHPIAGILWLKQQEAEIHGEVIEIESVVADVGNLSGGLKEEEKKHLSSLPIDVEDNANVTISFSDGTKALIIASDHVFGGTKNYIEIYSNQGTMLCNITPANNLMTYFLDDEGIESYPLAEMLPTKVGWNYAFLSDDVLRGYVGEIQDFMEAVAFDREPQSNFRLASDTLKVIYAAYVSAEEGKRLSFKELI